MRKHLIYLSILAFMLLAPLGAQAREINRLYVWDGATPLPADGSLPDGAIQWFTRSSVRYLFLPSGLDAANLHVHFTGADSFTVGDRLIGNDAITDVFVPGETVTITSGSTSYRVCVLQSQNTAGVYLKTQSGSIAKISESKRNHEAGSMLVVDENGKSNYRNDFEYIRVRGKIGRAHV